MCACACVCVCVCVCPRSSGVTDSSAAGSGSVHEGRTAPCTLSATQLVCPGEAPVACAAVRRGGGGARQLSRLQLRGGWGPRHAHSPAGHVESKPPSRCAKTVLHLQLLLIAIARLTHPPCTAVVAATADATQFSTMNKYNVR